MSTRERPIRPVRPVPQVEQSALVVLKLWNSGGPGLDFARFRAPIESGSDYELLDLKNLLRKDQSPDLTSMIARVVGAFQFLGQMTEVERTLAGDAVRRQHALADFLVAKVASA